jgi:hypothetical protein
MFLHDKLKEKGNRKNEKNQNKNDSAQTKKKTVL